MHTNTLSPEHHTVKMWTPQIVSDAAAKCAKLASSYVSNALCQMSALTKEDTYIVGNLLSASLGEQMSYIYHCLSHAESWMNELEKEELNTLFPELCNNRSEIIK